MTRSQALRTTRRHLNLKKSGEFPKRSYTTQLVHHQTTQALCSVCVLTSDGITTLSTAPTPVDITLGDVVIASGTTKEVYRLTQGADVFAAKCFKYIGQAGPMTPAENRRHLEEEFSRHVIATDIGTNFLQLAQWKKVQVHKFMFSECQMFSILSGTRKGWDYLADPYLGQPAVTKFSGTTTAGTNSDSLMGKTIDALAHFSVVTSDESLVLVDLQETPVYVNGMRDIANKLTLFDTMTHTIDGKSGLGDKGRAGIAQFKDQHQCNEICHALGFPRFSPARPSSGQVSMRMRNRELPLLETDNVSSASEASADKEPHLQQQIVTLTSGGYSPEGDLGEIHGDIPKTAGMRIGTRSQSYDEGRYVFFKAKLYFSGQQAADYLAIRAPDDKAEWFSHYMSYELHRFYLMKELFEDFETAAMDKTVELAGLGNRGRNM
ncbi:kinase-like domain-containing protein [Gautieria morchelliformis]|nr:kinase-like domain-containing protein [Gautieria morchelliformis]